MSEPSAITGLPLPHVATHAVGMPDWPRVILKPFFSSTPVRYFDVSTSWKPSSPKLNTESTASCASLARPSTCSATPRFERGRDWRCRPPAGAAGVAAGVGRRGLRKGRWPR